MNTHMKYLAGAALALALSSQASFAQQKTVTLMAYSGLFQERYMKAVVEPFMKANPDIKVEYFPLPNSAQMLGSLRAQKAAPQADIVIMDVSVSKAATDENLFLKIDEKNVPAVAELYPTARIAGCCRRGGHLRQSRADLQFGLHQGSAEILVRTRGQEVRRESDFQRHAGHSGPLACPHPRQGAWRHELPARMSTRASPRWARSRRTFSPGSRNPSRIR